MVLKKDLCVLTISKSSTIPFKVMGRSKMTTTLETCSWIYCFKNGPNEQLVQANLNSYHYLGIQKFRYHHEKQVLLLPNI